MDTKSYIKWVAELRVKFCYCNVKSRSRGKWCDGEEVHGWIHPMILLNASFTTYIHWMMEMRERLFQGCAAYLFDVYKISISSNFPGKRALQVNFRVYMFTGKAKGMSWFDVRGDSNRRLELSHVLNFIYFSFLSRCLKRSQPI